MIVAGPLPRLSGRRSIAALVTAAMFTDAVFYALIAPLLPDYSHRLGLGQLEVGLLFAAHPFGTVACAAAAAALVRRRGGALTMTLGLVSLGLATIGFGLSGSLAILLPCRFVQGASAALVWCAGLARLQGIAAPQRRGAALGLAGSAAGAGSLVGPALAAICSLTSVEGTLLVLGAATLALAAALYAGGELPGEHATIAGGGGEGGVRGWLGPVLARPLVVILTCGTVLGAVATLAPLRLAGLGAGAVAIAAAFALSALGEIVGAPLAGHVSDRVGRVVPMRLCLLAAIPLLAAQALAGSAMAMVAAVALTGAVAASLWPLATALLADEALRQRRSVAAVFGASVVAWSSGLVLGSLLCGAFAAGAGEGVAYASVAGLCALSALALASPSRAPQAAPQAISRVS